MQPVPKYTSVRSQALDRKNKILMHGTFKLKLRLIWLSFVRSFQDDSFMLKKRLAVNLGAVRGQPAFTPNSEYSPVPGRMEA